MLNIINFLLLILLLILIALINSNIQKRYDGRYERNYEVKKKRKMILGGGDYREVYIDNIGKDSGMIKYTDPVIGEIKTFNTKGDKYVDIHSNKQISQIAKYGSIQDFTRLINLIYKKLDWKLGNYERRKLAIKLAFSKNDNEVYETISKNMSDDFFKERNNPQAESIYRLLGRILNKYYKDKKPDILDVGCGSGNITKIIKDFIKLDKIYCVELDDGTLRSPDVEFKYVNLESGSKIWKLPYEDSSFDIVMMIMSLHHINNHESYIKEIYRILRPGGFVFVKEHDSWTAFDAMLVDIEHAIYMYHDGNKDFKGYYVHHFNYWTQNEIFKDFEYIKGDYYYINIKNELAPTRTMWGIVRKPLTPKEYERDSLFMEL